VTGHRTQLRAGPVPLLDMIGSLISWAPFCPAVGNSESTDKNGPAAAVSKVVRQTTGAEYPILLRYNLETRTARDDESHHIGRVTHFVSGFWD